VQDDQIGPESSKQPSLSVGTTTTLSLPCFTKEIVHFYFVIFLLCSS
jgi:hypothetical protein